MLVWALEFGLRLVAVPVLLELLNARILVVFAAIAAVIGTLPWWLPSLPVARIGHLARRIQGPPEGSWETAASATAGWTRVTFRSGVIAAAVLPGPAHEAAVFVALAMVLLWIIDGASQLARWLHPSREKLGEALGGYDPARFLQRSFDAALWLGLWPAVLLAFFGDAVVSAWLGLVAPAGMVQGFAAVIPLAAVAFVTGQWVHGRGGEGLVANVVRMEAIIVLALTMLTWLELGARAAVLALLVAQVLMSASRFPTACCRAIGAKPLPWITRRLAIALGVTMPAVALAVGGSVIRPPKNGAELAVTIALVTIAHLASTVTWWNLGSRRGW